MKLFKKSILFFAIVVNLTNVNAVSFDCNKASRLFEKSICSNSELSILDDELAAAYKNAVSANPEIKISQRDWIKKSRLCESDPSIIDKCIKNSYKDRIATLKNERNPSQAQASPSDVRVNSIQQEVTVQKINVVLKKDAPTQELKSATQTEQSGDGRFIKTVIVDGIGSDIPSAAQNAAQNALTEIVGSFMDANKVLEKKIEIRDGIRTQISKISTDIKEYSQGTIKSFEVIDAKNQSGLTRVTARVSVRMDDFRAYVKKLAEGEVNVGAGLFAQVAAEKKQLKNQSKLLADNVFSPIISGQAIEVKVGAPYPINQIESSGRTVSYLFKEKHGLGNIIAFDVDIALKDDFYQNMMKTLAATTVDSTKIPVRPSDYLAVATACDEKLKSTYPNDLCFFIINDAAGGYMTEVFKAQNARIEMIKIFPWLNHIGNSLKSSNGGPSIPSLEISLFGSNSNNLQSYLINQDTKNDDIELISDGNSSTPVSAPYSLLSSDGSGNFLGFIKSRKLKIAMVLSESLLKNTQKIIVKFVK